MTNHIKLIGTGYGPNSFQILRNWPQSQPYFDKNKTAQWQDEQTRKIIFDKLYELNELAFRNCVKHHLAFRQIQIEVEIYFIDWPLSPHTQGDNPLSLIRFKFIPETFEAFPKLYAWLKDIEADLFFSNKPGQRPLLKLSVQQNFVCQYSEMGLN